MTATAITETTGHLNVGDTWLLGVAVYKDTDGNLVDATVTVTVTKPDTTTTNPAAVRDSLGVYIASHEITQTGRYTARVVVTGPVVSAVPFAVDVETVGGARPTLAQVKDYLKDAATGWSDPQIQAALDAEAAAQARVCRIGAVYPPDLAEALKRRVRRNLAMRGIPLGVQNSPDGGPVRVGRDPEIRRLEAPFPKLKVG